MISSSSSSLSASRALLWWLALVVTYLGALVSLTASAWFRPGWVIGHPESDVWKHLWGDAWLISSLTEAWPVPLHNDLLWFPDGGLLYNLDPLTGFLASTLAPILGLVPAHNAIQGSSIVIGALAAYLLARHLTGDSAASAVAGAVYGFSAHIQGTVLSSGIGEAAHIAWLPLATLALLHVLEHPGWWRVALLAGSLFLAALGSWYYGLVTGLICAIVVIVWLARQLVRRTGSPRGWLVPLARVALGVALAGVMILPFANAFLVSLDPGSSLHHGQGGPVQFEELVPTASLAVASLTDFLAPGFRVQTQVDRLIFSSHLGFIPVTLAAFALITNPRRTWWLCAGALFSLLICLGPVVYLDRTTALVINPLFVALATLVPYFELVSNLDRVQVALSLCVALMATFGAGALFSAFGFQGRRRLTLGLLLAAVVIAEANASSMLGFPLPASDTRTPGIYDILKRQDAGAILELPAHRGPGGKAFWYQVRHGRPLLFNLDNMPTPSLADNRFLLALMPPPVIVDNSPGHGPWTPTEGDLEHGRRGLVEQGYTHAVLTAGQVAEQRYRAVYQVLETCCGPSIAEDPDRGIRIYSLLDER